MSSQKQIILAPAELQQRVWSTPMRTLAKEFGLSDVGLAKVCAKHQIPRPAQGHWVRVQLGQNPECTPLPEIDDPQLNVVRITARPKAVEELTQNIDPEVQALLVPLPIAIETDRPISHPLVVRIKKLLAHPRKDERGLLFPGEGKPLPYIRVSQAALPRALNVLDALFRAFDDRKIAITWDGSQGAKPHVTVLGENVTFCLSEAVERLPHSLTQEEEARKKRSPYAYLPQWDYKPTEELSLVISDVPYNSKIRQSWSDGIIQRLDNCLGAFVVGLHLAALALKKQRAERERWQREWDEQKRRTELERRREEEFQRKATIISEAADAWHTSQRIDQFGAALGNTSESAKLTDKQRRDLRRLARWAKGYAQRLNPILRFEQLVADFRREGEEEWGTGRAIAPRF